jgi:hypothetical protein
MSHIFISYSRRDLGLAEKIVDALRQEGVETWIDWRSIPKGEDWKQEIYRGIEGADALLFLISPESIKSQMCNEEILHAIQNNKRILPILLRDTDTHDFLSTAARAEIKRLNWIFCRKDQDDFTQAIKSVQDAIESDYEWLRFHTVLQTKALAWERAKRDGSRLLRGKELKETEARIARTGTDTEPYLTETQQQFMTASRRSLRRRRALPYNLILALAAAIFLGGKFFYRVIPIQRACPEVRQVSIRLQDSDLPAAIQRNLVLASEKSLSRTTIRACESGRVEVMDAVAHYKPEIDRIELSIRLPETPAYQLDFFQEIRQFGPELLSQAETIALLAASSAYSVGEYQTAIDLLKDNQNLSALTMLAQARLFSDDLSGSRAAYTRALEKSQPDASHVGKLYMGAALAWWRPESYYLLSSRGNKDDCQQAGNYYAQAEGWIQSDKLAQNIRILYARFCLDKKDPASVAYERWKDQPLQSEPDLSQKDAAEINAIQQYVLALDQEIKDEKARTLYKNRLIAAQPLMLARAELSEFFWVSEDNCQDARAWREKFRSGMISNLERNRLRELLQAQPLVCR